MEPSGPRSALQALALRHSAGHIPPVPSAVIRVVAAVIADGDRLLVCQRPPHKRHGGLWEFPGGKREPGETDAEAAGRELREELGVMATEVGAELFAARDPDSPYLIAFLPVRIAGAPGDAGVRSSGAARCLTTNRSARTPTRATRRAHVSEPKAQSGWESDFPTFRAAAPARIRGQLRGFDAFQLRHERVARGLVRDLPDLLLCFLDDRPHDAAPDESAVIY